MEQSTEGDLPQRQRFRCTFPDFEDGMVVHVSITRAHEAAEQAAEWWERDLEDFRVLRGEETLHIRVQTGDDVSLWKVLGMQGRYVAKPMKREP